MNPTIALIFCLISSSIFATLVSGAILCALIKNPPARPENLGTLKIAATIALPGWFAGIGSFALAYLWMV